MTMEKGASVTDIKPGQKVKGLFCVASKALRTAKNGSPFLTLTLLDKTGNIEARIWDNAAALNSEFERGDILLVDAEATEFSGRCQLKINRFEKARHEEVDPAHFLPVSPCDLDKAWRTCKKAMDELQDGTLAPLVKGIFRNRDTRDAFLKAPAAKKMHHAYIGGLLEHTASLVELTRQVVKKYGHLDIDLLLSGCLLHDLGKTRELSWSRPPIDYTDQGRLLGHISLGVQMVDQACMDLGIRTESERVCALKHIILSHHGKREFGSPVLPMTEEALVFHMLDDLDAKLNFLAGLKDSMEKGQGHSWSGYQHLFERYFYLLPHNEGAKGQKGPPSEEREESRQQPVQPSLWEMDES